MHKMFYKLKNADIRAEIDDRSEKIGKKIRDTELAKVLICWWWEKKK